MAQRVLIILVNTIFLTSLCLADIDKYAILLYGGRSELYYEEEFVEFEMGPMFELLINEYNFQNEHIYVHNMNADSISFYSHFTDSTTIDTVLNYFPAKPGYGNDNMFRNSLIKLNDNIKTSSNSEALIVIFISGHQRHVPDGPQNTRQWYYFRDGERPDSLFAQYIKNDLLKTGTADDISNKTRLVFVTGFCASYGFYEDILGSPKSGPPYYDQLREVCNTISYAAADSQNTGSSVETSPSFSFMKYWIDSMNDSAYSFDQAFYQARNRMWEHWRPIWGDSLRDHPFKGLKPSGWDAEWTLNGILPPSSASLSLNSVASGEISISLTSSRAETCMVYYDTNSGPPYNGTGAAEGNSPVEVIVTNGSGSLTLSGLTNGQRYYIAVKGKNYNGESPYSNEINHVPPITTSGTISHNEIWPADDDTDNIVDINSSVTLASGKTLTIQPGRFSPVFTIVG